MAVPAGASPLRGGRRGDRLGGGGGQTHRGVQAQGAGRGGQDVGPAQEQEEHELRQTQSRSEVGFKIKLLKNCRALSGLLILTGRLAFLSISGGQNWPKLKMFRK